MLLAPPGGPRPPPANLGGGAKPVRLKPIPLPGGGGPAELNPPPRPPDGTDWDDPVAQTFLIDDASLEGGVF